MMSNLSCSAIWRDPLAARHLRHSSLRRWLMSSRNSRCFALEIPVQVAELALLVAALGLAHRHPSLVELVLHALELVGELGQLVARFLNSPSSFFCARSAGANPRRMRSVPRRRSCLRSPRGADPDGGRTPGRPPQGSPPPGPRPERPDSSFITSCPTSETVTEGEL